MNSAELEQGMLEIQQAAQGVEPGMLGGAIAILAVMFVVIYIVASLGYFKMFKKAGHRGWLAYVPIVRSFVCYKFSWKVSFFWMWLVGTLVFNVCSNVEMLVVELIAIVVGIFTIVVDFKLCIKMAKSFGKGAGCGVLLFFFPFILSLVLGFGKAEYVGNAGMKEKEA